MNLCNEKQKSALKATKEGHNVLITGQCGTGASFLFRFMGDDDLVEEDQTVKAANILERLQAEAKAKKQVLQATSSKNKSLDHANEAREEGTKDKRLKVKDKLRKSDQHKSTSDSLNEDEISFYNDSEYEELQTNETSVNAEVHGDNKEVRKHKHKKKKHRHSLLEEPDSYTLAVKEETEEPVQSAKKHKRKHKHKSENDDSKSEIEKSDSDRLAGDNEPELDSISDEFVSKKKKKKHKHKHKERVERDEKDDSVAIEMDEEHYDEEHSVGMEEDLDETKEENDEKSFTDDRPDEIGGFTVIGDWKKNKTEKVKRVLPDWLSHPSVISADLKKDQLPVTDMPGLDKDLIERLLENKITHFFPVQMQVIPSLLESISTGFHIGRAGYRPSDICVSAPTGSGKTLAFVLPIIQALRNRVTCEVRALVVLPVKDLALQVFKVFQAYLEGSGLKVGLLVGQKTFSVEQQTIVRKRLRGYQSMYDIIVATPGRLVDHINKTEGFHLTHLRLLVIDEADRVMGEIKQDWLLQVESAVFKKNSHRLSPGPLTASSCSNAEMPLQKLLYSATLSSNPEKLQQLNLFQPRLYTSVVMATVNRKQFSQDTENTSEMLGAEADQAEEQADSIVRGEFVGKYTTPAGLSEYYIEATEAEKPLIVLYMLHHLKFRNVLCFTKTLEDTHRLFWIIKLVGGIEVKEFSSQRHAVQRDKVLKKFEAGKIDIIICSDVMARGMDIDNVKYVISYDPPVFIKTYVHRIGRTARAGKVGSAITLLQKKEFFHFKKMVRESGKSNIKAMKIMKQSLKTLIPSFKEALEQLPDVLKREKK